MYVSGTTITRYVIALIKMLYLLINSDTYGFTNDVTNCCRLTPTGECSLKEGEESSMVHIEFVDFVENGVYGAAVENSLHFQGDHVFLKKKYKCYMVTRCFQKKIFELICTLIY